MSQKLKFAPAEFIRRSARLEPVRRRLPRSWYGWHLRRLRSALIAFAMGDQARSLLPFLQRADEMAKADPKVAYYCRLYAVEEGMKIPDKSTELGEMLSLLVRQLEATKQAAGLLGAGGGRRGARRKLRAQDLCQGGQVRPPTRASASNPPVRGVGRSSPAGRLIPRTSLRHAPFPHRACDPSYPPRALASPCRPRRSPRPSPPPRPLQARPRGQERRQDGQDALRQPAFLEVLRCGASSRRISRRNRDTAAWRAGELSAAAREGRAPPPPPNTDEDPDPASGTGTPGTAGVDRFRGSTSWGAHRRGTLAGNNPRRASASASNTTSAPTCPRRRRRELSPATTANATSPSPYPSDALSPAVDAPSAPPSAPHIVGVPSPPANLPPVSYGDGIGIEHVAEAQKHAKFAVSALGFEDVPTAVDNLRRALALLTGRAEP